MAEVVGAIVESMSIERAIVNKCRWTFFEEEAVTNAVHPMRLGARAVG